MPYRETQFRAGEHYHVYNRGHSGGPIFLERANYAHFLYSWQRLVGDAVVVVCYCLMPNHYHLLVQLHTDELSDLLQRLMLSYSRAFNRWSQRSGSLFQGPFQAIHIGRDEYLLHLSRYIHLNPVAAGLVPHPEDWEFSSYRDYVGLRNGHLPKAGIVLDQLGSAQDYRKFVESYAEGGHTSIAHLTME